MLSQWKLFPQHNKEKKEKKSILSTKTGILNHMHAAMSGVTENHRNAK